LRGTKINGRKEMKKEKVPRINFENGIKLGFLLE
jgi:hypothetical protein